MSEKKIAILGLKGSGKSTFLAVLDRALGMKNSSWKITAKDATIEILKELQDFVFTKGVYPPPTPKERNMSFTVEREASMLGLQAGAPPFVLYAGDVPGEAVEGRSAADPVYQDFYQTFVRGCSAIIFLLDPEEFWRKDKNDQQDSNLDAYYSLFNSIISEIKGQSLTEVYMAFCVTKLDMKLPPNSEFDKHGIFDDVEKLAEDILGIGTKRLIDHKFEYEYLNWFATSATGYTGKGSSRTTQFFMRDMGDGKMAKGIRRPVDLTPIGVAEALEWALNSIVNSDDDIKTAKQHGKNYAGFQKSVRRLFGG